MFLNFQIIIYPFLQRFFGMMRDCCGSNDHPDSTLFIQMYKLISTYSLIKPPKGSNVKGSDILESLLNLNAIEDKNKKRKVWEGVIDTVIDKGNGSHLLGEASKILIEHNYTLSETSAYALTYIAGYVSRKGSRFAKYFDNGKPYICDDCVISLILPSENEKPERHKLIEIKSKGKLKHPSLNLCNLITVLEYATMKTVNDQEINANTLFEITRALEEIGPIPFVGCEEHAHLLTRKILMFYLTMRMFFICKQYNKNHNLLREQ